MSKVLVGIDCGVKTGVAMSINGKIELLKTMGIVHAMEFVEFECRGQVGVKIYIEDARKRTWIPKEKNLKARIGRAKGAGSVSRDAQIWEEFCKLHGFEYVLVAPKHNRTKLNAAQFKQLTGWHGRTNEHGRDAGMLLHKYLKNIGCKNEK